MIAIAGGILIVLLILGVALVGLAVIDNGDNIGWLIFACAVAAGLWVIL